MECKKIKENQCRKILEKIYKKPFPSVRPDFLKNPETGHNLEFDGYNEYLRIGMEYNGIQHYTFPNWAHNNIEEFISLVRRDRFKFEMCNLLNIYLIIIPYTVSLNELEKYIIERLPENITIQEKNNTS